MAENEGSRRKTPQYGWGRTIKHAVAHGVISRSVNIAWSCIWDRQDEIQDWIEKIFDWIG